MIEETVPHILTASEAAWNAVTAALVCFTVLLVSAVRRSGAEEFDFISWMISNVNRWIIGVVVLLIMSALTVLTPDVAAIAKLLGFDVTAAVPVSLGLALAAFLSTTTQAKAVPPAEDEDEKP